MIPIYNAYMVLKIKKLKYFLISMIIHPFQNTCISVLIAHSIKNVCSIIPIFEYL